MKERVRVIGSRRAFVGGVAGLSLFISACDSLVSEIADASKAGGGSNSRLSAAEERFWTEQASNHVESYRMATRNGDWETACILSMNISQIYLQAHREEAYVSWLRRSQADCDRSTDLAMHEARRRGAEFMQSVQ
jgi:hypothetical protein